MFVVVRKGFERITLIEAVQEFGADAVRLGLADAGDDFKDANFVASTCNSAMLTLYNLWDFYVISSLLLS
jgi:leucyl-tRNA synthetase